MSCINSSVGNHVILNFQQILCKMMCVHEPCISFTAAWELIIPSFSQPGLERSGYRGFYCSSYPGCIIGGKLVVMLSPTQWILFI